MGYRAFEPEGCFAVEIDGKLAGTAITLRYDASLGWIGMVLVHPDHRRHGLGTQLLRRSIDYLQARGAASIKLDATPMGRKVYVPLGFQDEYEVTRWEGMTPLGGARSPSALGPTAFGPENPRCPARSEIALHLINPGLVELDAAAFGVRRPQVLSALNARNPELCFMTGDQLDGYLIARQGREAIQVGPWVARDAACAVRLWAAFCRAAPARRVFLDIPAGNPAARELLVSAGFRIQRSFLRMYLGNPGPAGLPSLIFGTSGAEKG